MLLSSEAESRTGSSAAFKFFSLGLEQSANPLFLIGNDLGLLYANAAGQSLLCGKVLRLKAKRLITGRRTENAALQASFRVATETPSLVRLCDREGRGVMLLTIQRLEPSDELSVILVRAIDLQAVPLVCTGDISRLFGLSPAESRVAGSLLSGNDPSGIAEILKLSAETVRSHLKQAMAKTATHSQAQLISVLLRGSQAVVPPTLIQD